MTKAKRAIAAICAAVALTATGLTSSAAQAATDTDSGTLATQHCNDYRRFTNSGRVLGLPVYALFANYTKDCLLTWGDGSGSSGPGRGTGTSQAVWYLQFSLKYCNNASIALDGYYRDDTRDVVTWIQAANGITADGKYGPKTRTVIWWAFVNLDTGAYTCGRIA
ncbi:peptidoglycan-binding domain-containing protein [Streptomyces boninensis]|uniref:peptidoglycan-binding domain-containing protein n=1 Tax=Streptomyces boninensis TaxID=2039455 RepID=UPI003B20E30D